MKRIDPLDAAKFFTAWSAICLISGCLLFGVFVLHATLAGRPVLAKLLLVTQGRIDVILYVLFFTVLLVLGLWFLYLSIRLVLSPVVHASKHNERMPMRR